MSGWTLGVRWSGGDWPRAGGGHIATQDPKPTVVLVHGNWADASSWTRVIEQLQGDGFTVTAPPNNLRGPAADSAYRAYLETLPGPIVLVAHSYGGFVITNAATGLPNVKALVYVDAFIPDEGQQLGPLAGAESAIAVAATDPTSVFKLAPYPGAPEGVADTYLLPEVVASSFANDLSSEEAGLIAATQRPASLAQFADSSGAPAWKDLPAWAVIGMRDRIIPPEAQREMAEHAGAEIIEVDASHVSMLSKPDVIVDAIKSAASRIAQPVPALEASGLGRRAPHLINEYRQEANNEHEVCAGGNRHSDAHHGPRARAGRARERDHGDAGGLHPRPMASALELGELGRAVRGGRVRRADAGLARRSGNG
jgi:pimeloyl-ACP methyl ester carboxylesterase